MRTINTIALTATLTAATASGVTAGDLHSADFILALENDQIVTGAVDSGSGEIVFPARVKSAILGAEGFPNFTNNPGFNAQLGSLNPGMLIGFSILSAPRVWDPIAGDFQTLADETITVRASGQNFDAPTTDQRVEGIVFGQATLDAAASFHHHLQYLVNGGQPPAIDGLFLLEMELWTTASGIEPTKPLFIVFAQGDAAADLPDAIAYVEDTLIGPACPGDFNDDGSLNFFDLSGFLSAFNSQDLKADLNGDGVLNFFDLSEFLSRFSQGCP
ncbi:MAG: GC-type dockerin domain-anchored protein [Phycisphaerales bacterium]